jgi:probable HAF family extracellular repeat protein
MKFPAILGGLGALLLTNMAVAAPVYSITEIKPPVDSFYGTAMNESGQVAGTGPVTPGGPPHALLYSRGVVTDLGTLPGATSTVVTDINRRGQVVGYAGEETEPFSGQFTSVHGFVYTNGSLQDLGTLPGGNYVFTTAINDDGAVVGAAYSAADSCSQAFVYRNGVMSPVGTCETTQVAFFINKRGNIVGITPRNSNGRQQGFFSKDGTSVVTMNCLDNLPCSGRSYTEPADLNDKGQVTGFARDSAGVNHPYLYQNGVMKDLGSLGGQGGWGFAINASGAVTGYSLPAAGADRAFLYKDGKMLDLDPKGTADFSIGTDISDKDDVLGFAGNFTTGEFYDFLYTEGRMWKLKDLISPRSPLKGIVEIYFARMITANGYILADGFNTKTLVQTSYILKPMESED